MIRIICDRCKSERRCWRLEVPCHIAEADPGDKAGGYVDMDGNSVSGRMVDYDICAACRNLVYEAVMVVMRSGEKEKGKRR